MLGDHGCTTLQSEDGPSGLRIVVSNDPIDLLITDVGLPGGLTFDLWALAALVRGILPRAD